MSYLLEGAWREFAAPLLVASVVGSGVAAWRSLDRPARPKTATFWLQTIAAIYFWSALALVLPWLWPVTALHVAVLVRLGGRDAKHRTVRPAHLPDPICVVVCWAPRGRRGKRRLRGELLPPGNYVRA